MSQLARIAVGTIQQGAQLHAILWALMEALQRSGLQVQSFLSRACFPKYQGAAAVTGMVPRHLDSWLMPPEKCRETLLRGTQGADLALVEGKFGSAAERGEPGGDLEALCRWLSLSRVVVLDVAQLAEPGLPSRPEEVDGLLLDGVVDGRHLARLATDFEALWDVPVLGALEPLPRVRARLNALMAGDRPPPRLIRELGDCFTRYWHPQRLLSLAVKHDLPLGPSVSLAAEPERARLRVAIAYDEAFNCYFQDTFDLLELRGASVVDFSPLRDESLPPHTDVVYLGCGHPERRAATLAENHCMKAALRSHLAAGGRIYGEGGGAAYLCQQMEIPTGELKRMVGILPAVARLKPTPTVPMPLELTLGRANWFGERTARLRGYRNPHWEVQPLGELTSYAAEEEHRYDLVGSFRAIGSLLHVNFAAQPEFLRHFFYPHAPEPDFCDPWASAPGPNRS
ncbi:MAG: hypothetical protein ACYTG0_06220 [Planctomycetota bacterium]|jgi:cobyrinic acid a,c-diamide synthase